MADFDGDGKIDLVMANAGGVTVLLGNGTGSFKGPVSVAAGSNPVGVAVGDFNGDGRRDVVSANSELQQRLGAAQRRDLARGGYPFDHRQRRDRHRRKHRDDRRDLHGEPLGRVRPARERPLRHGERQRQSPGAIIRPRRGR